MFFVTGLPRSRTAWFAAFLDGMGGVRCHHELLNRCLSRDDFYARMEWQRPRTGNSDSGLWLTDFQQRWPDAPTLIIERDVEDVRASLAAIGLSGPVVDSMLDEQVEAHRSLRGMRVPFDQINDRVLEISDYLRVRFDFDRWGLFHNLKVELLEAHGNAEALSAWKPNV